MQIKSPNQSPTALHYSQSKTWLLLVWYPNAWGTKTPFKPYRGLLGIFSHSQSIHREDLNKFSKGKTGYTGKCNFSQGNLTFPLVKLPRVTTIIVNIDRFDLD